MVFLFVLEFLLSGGILMEDISKEEILSTINNNIKEYDLM